MMEPFSLIITTMMLSSQAITAQTESRQKEHRQERMKNIWQVEIFITESQGKH